MLAAVREFSPRVEYYSIDEFFFEAVPLRGHSFQETAEALRDHILQTVRVPVTVGIARTKTLAKLVSDTAKPFGALALLDRDAEWSLLEQLPVNAICGIADRRAARLAPYGIVTALDFAFADRLMIRSLLTRVGEALWYEVNGDPVVPLHVRRPPHKLLSRGGSIGEATADPNVLYGWVVRNLERLVEELDYHGVFAGRLAVWVGYRNCRAGAGESALMSPTDRFDILLDAARHGLRQAWRPRGIAQRVHLFASQLRWRGEVQPSLFDQPDEQASAVAALKKEVNARVGRFALRSGATLFLEEVYKDAAQDYDVCDVHGKMCF
jgi:nucleotidyltransferase/DNA polymerase involved in DNA repair